MAACCAVTLGDTPNFFGPHPTEQQVEDKEEIDPNKLYSQAGRIAASVRSKNAGVYRQERTPLKDSAHVGGYQQMIQQ